MSHLSQDELSAHLDGALTGAARERVERHLAECAQCRGALAELAAQDRALRPALEHDPGDAYFEDFAARVEDRIRAAGLTGAQSRLRGAGLWGWLGSPRRLAWVGAAAAVVAGAGIVILSSREVQRPAVDTMLESRAGQTAAKEQVAPAPRADQASRDEAGAERVRMTPSGPLEAPSKKSGAELQDRAMAEREVRQEAAGRVAPPAGEPPAPAATASRLQAVKRTAAGEDVPVESNQRKLATAPDQDEMARSGEADLKQAKPRAATPMAKTESGDVLSGATPEAPAIQGFAKDATQLCGRVVDDRGRPVSGAVVALADRGASVAADAQGRFCIAAPAGLHSLTAMAVGYAATRLQVRVEGEMSEALVTMHAVPVLEGKGAGGLPSAANGLIEGGAPSSSLRYFSKPPASEAAALLTERAARASRAADSIGTAPAYDAAATAWAKVVPIAAAGAPRLEARFRLAESRYEAWRLAPTATRAQAARAALDSFLREAPAGPRRDQAVGWRERVR